jgi:hypothetical protein
MDLSNYYHKNLETGKLNIYIDRVSFEAMSIEQKDIFSQFCIWNRKAGCWISKGKAKKSIYLRSRLNEFGIKNMGDAEGNVSNGAY